MHILPTLVLIVPCYNEQDIIDKSYRILSAAIKNLQSKKIISENSYISYIDDGSTDSSWEKILKYDNVRGIKFSKNYGHQAALLAGLFSNMADIYIPIDIDLQDDVDKIEEMISKYLNGADIVFAIRKQRKNADSPIKRFLAYTFYKFLKIMHKSTILDCGDFCLLSDNVVQQLKKYSSNNLYLRGLIQSLGYRVDFVYYARKKRIGGKNKYTFFKSLNLALSAVTSLSYTPIRLVSIFYVVSSVLFLGVVFLYAFYSIFQHSLSAERLLLICFLCIFNAFLFANAVLCEYFCKTYSEIRNYPAYIISEEKFQAD